MIEDLAGPRHVHWNDTRCCAPCAWWGMGWQTVRPWDGAIDVDADLRAVHEARSALTGVRRNLDPLVDRWALPSVLAVSPNLLTGRESVQSAIIVLYGALEPLERISAWRQWAQEYLPDPAAVAEARAARDAWRAGRPTDQW